MAETTCRVGDVNLPIEATFVDGKNVVVDISTATVTKDILLKRPDGTTSTRAASFTTNGTDGNIVYNTVAADITVKGVYYFQGHAVWGSNDRVTKWGSFTAEEKIGA